MNRCQAIKRNGKPCKQQGDNVIDCYCQYHHKFRIKQPEPPKKIMIDASTQTDLIEPPKPIEPPITIEPVEPIEPKQDEPIEPKQDEPIEPKQDEPIEPVEPKQDEPVKLTTKDKKELTKLLIEDCGGWIWDSQEYRWKKELQGYRLRVYAKCFSNNQLKPVNDQDLFAKQRKIKRIIINYFETNKHLNITHPKIHMIKQYEIC